MNPGLADSKYPMLSHAPCTEVQGSSNKQPGEQMNRGAKEVGRERVEKAREQQKHMNQQVDPPGARRRQLQKPPSINERPASATSAASVQPVCPCLARGSGLPDCLPDTAYPPASVAE